MRPAADTERGVSVNFSQIIAFTAGGLTVVVAAARLLLGFALSD